MVNKHNVRFWGSEKPRFTVQHMQDSPKINVFCAVSKKKVYGPFFLHEKTVTGSSFLDMLSLWLMPQLQDDSDNFVLQLDGAPPHWSGDVRTYLDQHLPHRWIGRSADHNMPLTQWPPRSPDLTPCDFDLWGYIKDNICTPPLPVDFAELKQRITSSITAIASDTLTRVWAEMDYQFDVCRVTKGAHIEHLLLSLQKLETFTYTSFTGKRSCHTGIGLAAGWVIPMSFLLSSERMRSYGCDSAHAAAEFFQKSCLPGALSREYTVGDWQYGTLCDLCHGSSSHFCSRSSAEPFYGHTGALRCLVEGGGEIAFVKHTTIVENTAGKNQDWWSRPLMPDDFELLCRDGTRAHYSKHEDCNLGKVSANAIVADASKPHHYINAYVDLFMYAQQYYGSKYSEEFTFKMFVSEDGYSDLIFQDATQQLKVVPKEKRNYRDYLGYEFLQAMRIVDCMAGASAVRNSFVFTALLTAISFVL